MGDNVGKVELGGSSRFEDAGCTVYVTAPAGLGRQLCFWEGDMYQTTTGILGLGRWGFL